MKFNAEKSYKSFFSHVFLNANYDVINMCIFPYFLKKLQKTPIFNGIFFQITLSTGIAHKDLEICDLLLNFAQNIKKLTWATAVDTVF